MEDSNHRKRNHKNRIAVVAHSHPSLSKGGAEIAAYSLFQGLLKLGQEVFFIAACPETARDRIALNSDREFVVYYDPRLYDHFHHLAAASVTEQLEELIQRLDVKVVNFHHFFSLGLVAIDRIARRAHVRTVLTLHEFLAICNNHGQMITLPSRWLCSSLAPKSCVACFPEITRENFELRRDLFLRVFGLIDHFVSPSRFLAERYTQWGIPAEKISVIENGLTDLPAATPHKNKSGKSTWVFGFFGQINPYKGVDTILRAVQLIAKNRSLRTRVDIRLHGNVIGQTDAFINEFKNATDSNKFLTYAGPYDNSMVLELMRECDYILVPSSWWENSPVVIQEAFAAGRPVICSGIGGMAEKVHDQVNGIHFKRGDANDLVRAIAVAADNDVYNRLASQVPRVLTSVDMARSYNEKFK